MPTQHHRPSRHLWVGNFPEDVTRDKILNYFGKYGRIEEVHILPQKHPSQGIAAFIDFYECSDAIGACRERHRMGGRDLRLNYKFTDKSSPDSAHSPPPRGGKDNQRDQRMRKKRSTPSSDGDDSSGSDSSQSSSSDSEPNRSRKKGPLKKKTKDNSSGADSSDSSDSDEDSEDEREKKFGHQMKVLNVNSRPSDQNVEEQLSAEFKKYGSPTVRVQWNKNDRIAILKFRSTEDCKKAFKSKNSCTLFGQKLKLVPLPDSRSGGHREGSPGREDGSELSATRCLFVGNIPKGVSVYELRDTFLPFGMILDAQIKKMSGNITYGFVHFLDLMSAIVAQKRMNGERMGISRLKVGFGRGSPSKAIWVDGIDPHSSEATLERHFSKFGDIMKMVMDRRKRCALIVYDSIDTAKDAMTAMKGTFIGKSRSPAVTDFASKDAIQAFTQAVEMGGPPGGGPFPPGGMPGMPYDPMMMGGPPPMMHGYFPPGPGAGMMGGYPPPYPGPMDPYGHPRRGHHGYGWEPMNEDLDDYSRELEVFQRRRERVKEREGRSRGRHHSRESSESSSDESKSSQRRRKRRLNSGTGSEGERKDLREVLNKRKDNKHSRVQSPRGRVAQKGLKKARHTDNSESESGSEKKRKKSTERPWSPPMEEVWGESGSEGDTSGKKPTSSAHSSTSAGKGKAPKPAKPPKTPSDHEDSAEEKEEQEPEKKVRGPRTPSVSPHRNLPTGPMTPPSSENEMEQERNGPKTPSLSPEPEEPAMERVPNVRPTYPPPRRERGERLPEPPRRERSPHGQYEHKHWRKSPPPRLRSPERRSRHSPSPVRHRSPPFSRGRSPLMSRGKSPPYRGHHHRSPSPHGRYRDNRDIRMARSPDRYPGRRSSPMRSSRDRRRYGRSRSRSPPPRDVMRSRSPPHFHHRGRSPPPHRLRTPPRRKSRSPPTWSRNKSPVSKRSRSPRARSPVGRSKGGGSPPHHRRGGDHSAAPPPPPKVPRTPSATPPPPEEEVEHKRASPIPPVREAPPPQPRIPISFKIKSGVQPIVQSATLSHSPEEEEEEEREESEAAAVELGKQGPSQPPSESQALLDLLRRYPVMWQGHLTLKNEVAAVQLHYLKGSIELAKLSLPQPQEGQTTAGLKILKRMRLEANQLEGVEKRMEHDSEHCLLLALPCGRDPVDVLTQTKALKTGFINYLLQKQAAGIIDMAVGTMNYVLHIFPPCDFSQDHLTRVAPDLLSSASDSGHLMIVVASS